MLDVLFPSLSPSSTCLLSLEHSQYSTSHIGSTLAGSSTDDRFGSKVGQIGPKCDKSSFSAQSQNVLRYFLKIPVFIPFDLTHFRPKSGNYMPAWLLSLTNVSTLHYSKMTGLRNDCVSVLSATTHCTPRWQSSIASYRARHERCA